MNRVFVGRRTELQQTLSILERGARGQGGVVLIEGQKGTGKTRFVEEVKAGTSSRTSLKGAEFVEVECYESTSSQNAYAPFVDIFEQLRSSSRQSKGRSFLTTMKETAPDWVQGFPVVGRGVSSSLNSMQKKGSTLSDPESLRIGGLSSTLMSQYITTIGKIATHCAPLILVIEDAQWLDEASSQLLLRLTRKVAELQLVIVVTCRTDYSGDRHLLPKVFDELHSVPDVLVVSLSNWTTTEVRYYLESSYLGVPVNELAGWLMHLCNGNPFFVIHYLKWLQDEKVLTYSGQRYALRGSIRESTGEWKVTGPLRQVGIPQTIEKLLEKRIEKLEQQDRRLLELGAVQGEYFTSAVVAEIAGQDENTVWLLLREIRDKHGMIDYYPGADYLSLQTEVYKFEHHLLQQAFYDKIRNFERIATHRRIAKILERGLDGSVTSPRKVLLEVAYHYARAMEHLLAARYLYSAARSSFLTGAFVDTVDLCAQALNEMQQVEGNIAENDRLRAEMIELCLHASEFWWSTKPELPNELRINDLILEAERAAQRVGDLRLITRVRFLNGQINIATRNLDVGIEAMLEALELARSCDDYASQFAILTTLGNALNVRSLEEGMPLLEEAYKLYQDKLSASPPMGSSISVGRDLHRLIGLIGIGEFDLGNYEAALEWLNKSVIGLRDLGMLYDMSRMVGYQGIVYTALGQFEQAEAVLQEGSKAITDSEPLNPWQAYNLALLGKLYIEWDRPQQAYGPLRSSWSDVRATGRIGLVVLIRNHLAELLMHPRFLSRDLDQAELLLNETLEEVAVSGFSNGRIAALSLRSRIYLQRGSIDEAVQDSTEAVNLLQAASYVATVRTEEVLLNHYNVLVRAGLPGARDYITRSHEEVQRKAASIATKEFLESFLSRVPINREILDAFRKEQIRDHMQANMPTNL